MFKGKMETPATPERVYYLCKLLENGPKNSVDLKSKMFPKILDPNGDSGYFGNIRKAAEELELVVIEDNMIKLLAPTNILVSQESFREYINNFIYNLSDDEFYDVTKAYFTLGTEIITTVSNNVSEYSKVIDNATNHRYKLDNTTQNAWRFWATYLGFGDIFKNNMFIPNCKVFLQDLINHSGLEKNKSYSAQEFISGLGRSFDILGNEGNVMNYGTTNGLRSLHELKVIKMEHILDNDKAIVLYKNNDPDLSESITNITILEA